MLPDEMEAEKNRKIILAQADEIDILKRNVRELEEQLRDARKRNANLIQEKFNLYDDISNMLEEDTNATTKHERSPTCEV